MGKPIQRKEDRRVVLSSMKFIDDLNPPDLVYVAIVRSQYAHARIKKIDTSGLLEDSRVLACFTGEDLVNSMNPMPFLISPSDSKSAKVYPLAVGKVRFVGEPILAVVVSDLYDSSEVLDKVQIDFEPLPPIVNAEDAADKQSEKNKIYEDWADNVAWSFAVHNGNVDKSFDEAFLKVAGRFSINRQYGAAMDTRGTVASYDPADEMLTVWSTSQWPHLLRSLLAEILDHPENKIHVIAPDIGGGFGNKQDLYREEILLPFIAKKLKRSVKWVATRSDDISSTSHCREQIHDAEMSFDKSGRILALRDRFIADIGAFGPMSVGPPIVTTVTMTGAYKIDNVALDLKCVVTNKVQTGAFRGFGYPESTFVIERLLDIAASTLGIDPAEIRKRNFVSEFPYNTSAGALLDSGNYSEMLDKALEAIDYDSFRKRQKELAQRSRFVGLGFGMGLLGGGWGPSRILEGFGAKYKGYDTVSISVEQDGGIIVRTGLSPHGTGLETTLSQVCADELGVDVKDIMVVHGDSMTSPFGFGTWGSRSLVIGANAARICIEKLRAKALALASYKMNLPVDKLEYRNGGVQLIGDKEHRISLGEISRISYAPTSLPAHMEPGLEATATYEPKELAISAGLHVAIVEVDPKTCEIKILRYVMVHDCGKMINPMIVEGQLHGGLAQGVGAAMLEEIRYDENGQLLTGSFMDYLVPSSMEIPKFELLHVETPSPYNEMGLKGAGEDGIVGPPSAITNAICDAFKMYGLKINKTPITPPDLWLALRALGFGSKNAS